MALVDLDLCLGDADVFLDTIPDYTLVDVAQCDAARLHAAETLVDQAFLGPVPAAAPVQLEDMALITPEDLQRVIGLLKATFTHLVLDLRRATARGPGRPGNGHADSAGDPLDLPCLRNVVRLMTSFTQMNGLADKVKIIVNRVGLDYGPDHAEKSPETIGKDIFWQLPNDYRTMIEVRNNGVPLLEQRPEGGHHPVDWRPGRRPGQRRKEPGGRPAQGFFRHRQLFGFWPAKAGR